MFHYKPSILGVPPICGNPHFPSFSIIFHHFPSFSIPRHPASSCGIPIAWPRCTPRRPRAPPRPWRRPSSGAPARWSPGPVTQPVGQKSHGQIDTVLHIHVHIIIHTQKFVYVYVYYRYQMLRPRMLNHALLCFGLFWMLINGYKWSHAII